MTENCIIYITTSSHEEALKIGRGLVSSKLAACVQITKSIKSIYIWKDELCEEEEFIMIVKSVSSLFDKVADYVKGNHSYEVVQIVSVPIEKGTTEYLDWLKNSCIPN